MPSLESAKRKLLTRLFDLRAPHFEPQASSADMLAARDHLKEVASAVDAYVLALGECAKDSTGSIFSVDLFRGNLSDALDLSGALYELEAVAEETSKRALAGGGP